MPSNEKERAPVAKRDNASDHPDVMVSSTYLDLRQHREAAVDALLRLGYFPIGMEYDSAKSGKDTIDASLAKVKKAHAYVGIISHRYGGVPTDGKRNPKELSITELEYRAALARDIPVYMFVMSDKHPVTLEDVEKVEANRTKLASLKEDVRLRSIYAEFSSVEMLKGLILQSMAELRIEEEGKARAKQPVRGSARDKKKEPRLPSPPALLAIPDFTSGHEFVGRRTELAWLDEWAASDDPLMVIEAIGGTGKSTLSWYWLKDRAKKVIPNLAGMFWYSFYEGGADMAAFAAYALAYATGRPLKEFRGRKTSDLGRSLITALHEHPFLLVLDGFERVLVAYHRLDASQARDDEVSAGSDDRACIKPADGELLRQLVAVAPSKILVTSRLMPTPLANTAGRPLPGVSHRTLAGIQPDDAIAMLRGLGIRGDAPAISRYLKENFDNHPLVVGIVGGLVADYVRDPGNFDRWASDPQGGAALHLTKLDLKQRRTHILAAALNGLEPEVRRLLSFIAALGYPVPFETIAVLNPIVFHDPIRETGTSHEDEARSLEDLPRLISALQELERRGLLQWDRQKNRYDLHPVVRGYAFDVLEKPERRDIGNQIVDYFESKPSDYAKLGTLADAQQSITIMRALVQADRLDDAGRFFLGDFSHALLFSLEEYHEVLALLKPMFPNGFQALPSVTTAVDQASLLNDVANALHGLNRYSESRESLSEALRIVIAESDHAEVRRLLSNWARVDEDDHHMVRSLNAFELAVSIAEVIQDRDARTRLHFDLMGIYIDTGFFERAESEYETFRQLPIPPDQFISMGEMEARLCWLRFCQGSLTTELIDSAKSAAHLVNNRHTLRALSQLQGDAALKGGDPVSAIIEYERSIEMAQTVGIPASDIEGRLALAKVQTDEPHEATEICKRLEELPDPPHLELAEAYLQLGVTDRARDTPWQHIPRHGQMVRNTPFGGSSVVAEPSSKLSEN
jgi:tetratricopeptide (TPR) repeat protein